ncbi:MAG: IS200/IS605 family transposase [Eubacteriales bacterium]|nr:IS200/IS605 family transposase [Eubacteriales bacterium]
MKLKKEGYYTNRHRCFLLQYHLVLVTKFRHPVITDEVEEELKAYTKCFFERRELVLQEMECMPDHIHILFDGMPQINLAELVNAYKTATSRRLRKLYPEALSRYYWKPYFWSLSYFIGSDSDRSVQAVKQYIQNQKN